jgi:hypothetical protein
MHASRAIFIALLASSGGGPGCQALRERPAEKEPPFTEVLLGRYELPADTELLRQTETALDLRLREDADRFLDAVEPGELLEHATLTQTELERAGLGLEALLVVGDELFDYDFRPENGLGNDLAGRSGIPAGGQPAPNLRRVHQGEFGGPDSHSCASCHLKGGPDGAGNNTQNAFLRSDGESTLQADVRNPPHLLGLGPVQALALEMTRELQGEREKALLEARDQARPVEAALQSKGVRFGVLKALPDGEVDPSRIEGIDPDLVVKPFGWKGHQANLREMAEESFRIHLGLLSMHDQEEVRAGKAAREMYGDGDWYDLDRDGTTLEVDEGMLTTIVVYLSQLETPVIRPPQSAPLADRFARGAALFDSAGCSGCHRPFLELKDPVLVVRPRGPAGQGKEPLRVNVAEDGDRPKIEPADASRTSFLVRLFSDLKRHDMGPDLATPIVQAGIPRTVFLTRPLWGLGFTSPYLHDGRAPTLDDAIRLHGGEAAASRGRYLELEPADRAALQVFLLSLTRKPKLFVP